MPSAPIVVGTDGSPTAQRAVTRAADLASALDAALHVVTSCELVPSAMVSAVAAYAPVVTDDDSALRHAREVVDRARAELRERGLTAETHVCTGDPADALLTVATGLEAQMIVVGNRGMSGARRVLGSVPNRVSHHASCEVLIVPTAG